MKNPVATRGALRKSQRLPAHLVPGNPGNSGGKPGRSGRLPDAFKAMCRELVSQDETLEVVRAILSDGNHPLFLGALKWATEHGYGKATEKHEVTGAAGGPIRHVWRFGNGRVIEF